MGHANWLLLSLNALYMSGYALNVLGPAERLESGVELLLKPYTPKTLARILGQVLGKRSAHLPSAEADAHAKMHNRALG